MPVAVFASLLSFLFLMAGLARAQEVDVTSLINAALNGNSLNYFVSEKSLGRPAPDVLNRLKVRYTLNGLPRTKIIPENGTLRILAASGQKLVITKATYGDIQERYFDVEGILTAAIKQNVLTINVNNGTFKGDPDIGVQKELCVSYTVDGAPFTATALENDTLTLPEIGKGALVIIEAEYGTF